MFFYNDVFKALKNSNITTIIDFRSEASITGKYAKKTIFNDLNYFLFPIDYNAIQFFKFNKRNSKFTIEEQKGVTHNFAILMKKFFDLMNKGHLYIGCLLGLHRTDFAVIINYLLNPKEPKTPPILSHMIYNSEKDVTDEKIGKTINLFNNISVDDKRMFGYGQKFKDILKDRISKLKRANLK